MPLKAPQAEDDRLVVRTPFCNWQHSHALELAVNVRNSEIELMKNALIIVGSLLSVYVLSLMPIDRNSQDTTYFTDVTRTHLQGGAVGNTMDGQAIDIDNDGDLDMILAMEFQTNKVLINNGSGQLVDESKSRFPSDVHDSEDIAIADFDGDVDLFFSNVDFGGFGDPQNRLLLNDGKGYFKEATDLLPQSNFRTVDTDFVDLNKDGFLDLLVGNRFNGNEHMAWINQSGQKFTDQTSQFFSGMNMYPFDFQSADFNGDGITDLFICGFRGPDKLLFGKQ